MTQHVIEIMAIAKYEMSLAMRISLIRTGVAIKASIVPLSHSRAMTRAVSVVPISVMMMAKDPGMRKLRLAKVSLNQYRGWTLIRGSPVILLAIFSWVSHFAHAWET